MIVDDPGLVNNSALIHLYSQYHLRLIPVWFLFALWSFITHVHMYSTEAILPTSEMYMNFVAFDRVNLLCIRKGAKNVATNHWPR